MAESVYIESSILSYLTARPSRDIVIAGIQELTREWWDSQREQYELFLSESVLKEISQGDSEASRKRMEAAFGIPSLIIDDESMQLSRRILQGSQLSEKSMEDSLHIAIATVNNIEYLLTWNCRHIANAKIIPKVEQVCRNYGYQCPRICTPQELME